MYSMLKALKSDIINASEPEERRNYWEQLHQATDWKMTRNKLERMWIREAPNSPTKGYRPDIDTVEQYVLGEGNNGGNYEYLHSEIEMDEMILGIRLAKNGKAADYNGITAEMNKYAPRTIWEELRQLFNLVLETETLPRNISRTRQVDIAKKPGATEPNFMRPIKITNTDAKLFEAILLRRMNRFMEETEPIHWTIGGNRGERSALDQVLAIRLSIEIHRNERPGDCIVLGNWDGVKAYDTEPTQYFEMEMMNRGCPPKFLRILRILNKQVISGDWKEPYEMERGFPQGSRLAPAKYCIGTIALAEKSIYKQHGLQLPAAAEGTEKIGLFQFVDDKVTVSAEAGEIQRNKKRLHSDSRSKHDRKNDERNKEED